MNLDRTANLIRQGGRHVTRAVVSLFDAERGVRPTLALCASLPKGMATCATELTADDKLDGWKLLMPLGAFKANDGRAWTLTNAKAVIAASKLPALIDFDHGTQMSGNSRAAAWIEEMKPQGPNGEPGIWGRVEGTADGKAALLSKSYRFFSPTFLHNAARVVTRIVGGSLVNNPALDELPALASQQETALTLEELLAKLRKALGLADTATADDIIAAIAAQTSNATATAAAQTHLGAIATAAGLTIAADKFGTDHLTAICTKLKTPATADGETVATLSAKVFDLTGRLNAAELASASTTAEQTIDDAVKAGKIAPAMKVEMLALCKANPVGFAAMLAKAPVILPGGRVQITAPAEGALTDDQLAICKQQGIAPEAYKKTLAAMAQQEIA